MSAANVRPKKNADLPDVEQRSTEAGLKVKRATENERYRKLTCAGCISVKSVTERKFSDSPKATLENDEMIARNTTTTDSKGEPVACAISSVHLGKKKRTYWHRRKMSRETERRMWWNKARTDMEFIGIWAC